MNNSSTKEFVYIYISTRIYMYIHALGICVSIGLSIDLAINVSMYAWMGPSIHSSIHPPIHPSIPLSSLSLISAISTMPLVPVPCIYLSFCLSIYLHIYLLSMDLSMYLSIYLSSYLRFSVHIYIYIYTCVCVRLMCAFIYLYTYSIIHFKASSLKGLKGSALERVVFKVYRSWGSGFEARVSPLQGTSFGVRGRMWGLFPTQLLSRDSKLKVYRALGYRALAYEYVAICAVCIHLGYMLGQAPCEVARDTPKVCDL